MIISTWIERLKDLWAEKVGQLGGNVGARVIYMGVLVALPMLFAIGYVGWQNLSETSVNHSQVLSASAAVGEVEADERSGKGQSEQDLDADEKAEGAESIIWVDVSGAVRTPGLKKMNEGARVSLALELAGGYADDADEAYTGQVLNLAQVLEDGDKIYIPTKSQVLAAMPTPVALYGQDGVTPLQLLSSSSQGTALVTSRVKGDEGDGNGDGNGNGNGNGGSGKTAGVVMVNEAAESELLSLPGVGPATAKKIMEARPYQDHEALCQVINNSRTCAGLVDLISF